MKAIIGDIGNTVTKICLLDVKTLKANKIIYFNSTSIKYKNLLKKNLNKIITKNNMFKVALFSSVVPSYQIILKKMETLMLKLKLKVGTKI